MSTDFYFWNKTKNEHMYAYGNHNRQDTLRYNWSKLLAWAMMNNWVECEIICIPDSSDISVLNESKDVTNIIIQKWNEEPFADAKIKAHGKFEYNKYAPDIKNHEQNDNKDRR